jgi:tetratricopeptide (TPR) repeat protein
MTGWRLLGMTGWRLLATGWRPLGMALLLCIPTAAPSDAQTTSPPDRRALVQLESHLAAGDFARARAVLEGLQPAIDGDERLALDTMYVLISGRAFSEARDQWNRLAPRLQEGLRSAAATPGEEQARQRRAAEALFVQGLLTARLGEKKEALGYLQKADGYGFPPLDSPLMLLAADCLFELQEHALAAQAYQEIVSRAPENVAARLRLAASLLTAGKLAAAEKELQEVLRRAPDQPQASFYLGAVLFEQKRTGEARARLERELGLDPRCYGCMAKLAHVAYLDGDDALCQSWLEKAAALEPGYVETNLVAGMLASRQGRYDEAVRSLLRVLEQAPDYAQAHYQLALAYRRAGDARRAGEHQATYDRLVREQKARTLGVRGGPDG